MLGAFMADPWVLLIHRLPVFRYLAAGALGAKIISAAAGVYAHEVSYG